MESRIGGEGARLYIYVPRALFERISSKISLAVYFFIFCTQKCEMHIFYRPTPELNVSKPRFQKK